MLSCLPSPRDNLEIALSAISYELIALVLSVYTVVLINVKLNPIAQTVIHRTNLKQFNDHEGSSGT